jgi:hypothetical protein
VEVENQRYPVTFKFNYKIPLMIQWGFSFILKRKYKFLRGEFEMNLTNFEEYIDHQILKRGLDYFEKRKIVGLEALVEGTYKAKVDGSELYSVEITIDKKEEVTDSYCNCPYDFGEFCKHEVAVLFALKNEKAGGQVRVGEEKNLQKLLASQSTDALMNIILEISNLYPDVEKRLLFKLTNNEDEISASKKLIREYINNAKSKGFIHWRNLDYALQGAEMTLEKAQTKIEIGDIETAVLLSLAVLAPVIKMLDFSDDSNGSISPVLDKAVLTVGQAVTSSLEHLTEKEQNKLFDLILKESLKAQYDSWDDWRFSLLEICVQFIHIGDLRKKLEMKLIALEEKAGTSWNKDFTKKRLKLLQLGVIEKCDGMDEAEKFIYENIHYSDFREKAIIRAFNRGEFKKVVELCVYGEENDVMYHGLVAKWRNYRYQAYEELADTDNQRKLAYELILSNDFSYYLKLKELYNRDEWEEILNTLLEVLEKDHYQSPVYLRVLKQENLTDRLLNYCSRYKSYISELYPYIIESHLDDVVRLFREYIESEARESSDRRGYKNVCKIIKTYKKACGVIHSHKLIGELIQTYPRRPAFVDELEKIR